MKRKQDFWNRIGFWQVTALMFAFGMLIFMFAYEQAVQPVDEQKGWVCHMAIEANKVLGNEDFNFTLKTFDLTLPCSDFEVQNIFATIQEVG